MTVASFCARELLRPLLERCSTNISIFTTQALEKCWWQLLCCFILIHSGLALGEGVLCVLFVAFIWTASSARVRRG